MLKFAKAKGTSLVLPLTELEMLLSKSSLSEVGLPISKLDEPEVLISLLSEAGLPISKLELVSEIGLLTSKFDKSEETSKFKKSADSSGSFSSLLEVCFFGMYLYSPCFSECNFSDNLAKALNSSLTSTVSSLHSLAMNFEISHCFNPANSSLCFSVLSLRYKMNGFWGRGGVELFLYLLVFVELIKSTSTVMVKS